MATIYCKRFRFPNLRPLSFKTKPLHGQALPSHCTISWELGCGETVQENADALAAAIAVNLIFFPLRQSLVSSASIYETVTK